MKILSVATSDRGGGAERMAWLYFDAYRARGHDSWLAVGEKKSDDDRVVPFHTSPHVEYRPYGRVVPSWLRGAAKGIDRALGIEDFRHPYSRHLLQLVGSPPDLVHLHNLHGGYFDLRVMPELSRRVPVFLSIHDLWTLTGHCAFPVTCDRWQRGCGACPDLAAPPDVRRDATRWNFRRKRAIWARSRLRVLAPGEWSKRQIERSMLAPAVEEIRVIPNAADLGAFAPGSRAAARRRLGIPVDAQVVAFVANGTFANPYKDGAAVLESARRLASSRTGSPTWLLAVGGTRGDERIGGLHVRHAGYVAEPEEMALHYHAADVLLHASRSEVFPLAIIEALACGLPVVAAAVGGVPELVHDGRTGRLFPRGDVDEAVRGVAWCLDHPAEARARADEGARFVRRHCDRERMADRTLAWFDEVLARQAPRTRSEPGALPVGLLAHARARSRETLRRHDRALRAVRKVRRARLVAVERLVHALRLGPRLGRLQQHEPRPLRAPEGAPATLPMPPLISMVTPSLDQGRFLARTLESVLSQGYPQLEYVVQDGGSSDGVTARVLAAHADRLHEIESGPDGGQAEAINRGFAKTSGEIMAWLNADDLLLPGSLACVARHFTENPDVDVVYGHRILIDEDDREIGRWILPAHDAEVLRWVDFVPQETLFWRRRAWEKVGARLDESFRYALDWDLLLRFAAADLRIVRLPRFLGGFRVHPEQKTTAIPEVGREEVERLRLRELGFVPGPETIRRRLLGYYLRHLALHARYRLGLRPR